MLLSIIEASDNAKNLLLTIRPFIGKIHPRDLKLSDVTATSAAALALYMGVYDVRTEAVRKLQMVLGIHFGKALVSDPSEDVAGSTFSYCMVGFMFFALITFARACFWNKSTRSTCPKLLFC